MKRSRRLLPYGENYTRNLIRKVNESQGVIFVAEHKNKLVGFAACIIEKQTKGDLLECKPTKPGRLLDLIVTKKFRSSGIGKLLMNKTEDYLRGSKCDVVKTDVFWPNKVAYKFYQKLKYKNRMMYMIKAL